MHGRRINHDFMRNVSCAEDLPHDAFQDGIYADLRRVYISRFNRGTSLSVQFGRLWQDVQI